MQRSHRLLLRNSTNTKGHREINYQHERCLSANQDYRTGERPGNQYDSNE